MRTKLLFLVFLFLAINLQAQVEKAINTFVSDSVFRHAGISICFRDVASGELLDSYNENLALTSASVMKLVTTGTTLEILGPRKVFSTRIAYVGSINEGSLEGYLIIHGGGDPALGSEYFKDHYGDFLEEWLKSVKEAGIKHIKGRVIADASVFSYKPAAPGWTWSDIGNYYGAGVHGLSAFDNMYRIFFRTGKEGSKPEILGIEPQVPGLEIESHLIALGSIDKGYVYLEPFGKHAKIRGIVPIERDTFTLKAAMPDPPLMLATMLHNKLTESGISISKTPASHREMPDYMTDVLLSTLEYINTTTSPPLGEIIHITNLESINLFAETMVWTLDYQINQHMMANLSGGLEVIMDFLLTHNISSSGLYMTDGSGLSRSNAVSSAFMTSFLVYMGRDARYKEVFRNSLAVPGTGTLEPYFLSNDLKNNLRAKSGTVSRARNYAGYLKTRSGREISFAVFANNFDCSSHQVTRRVEKLMEEVYKRY